MGDGLSFNFSAILAMFLLLRANTSVIHSMEGFAKLVPIPADNACTQEPISPTNGAAIGTLLSISVGAISIWINWRLAALVPPQVLPLPCDSSQFSRAPMSTTTSASANT